MPDLALRTEAMGKRYRIGASPSARRLLGRLTPWTSPDEHIWALRDISFEVRAGEVVGVVGRNGAGKSTLLKILSRITEPTEGRGEIHGRVGSLLEVGTGFHPELTGRENVFLNGAILGMRRAEIARHFDDIVGFAEVEQFIDTPVKRYSSGMYLRLAFAVAAHLEPDILLVDEVLAVGDAAFQRRCLGRMGDVARQGRTVLFVSHNMSAIRSLCDYALYLKDGRVAANAGVDDVLTQYGTELAQPDRAFPVEAGDVVVHAFEVEQEDGGTTDLDGSRAATVRVRFELLRDLGDFRLGVYLNSPWGGTVARSFLADWDSKREALAAGRYEATLEIPAKFLVAGSYSLLLHASRYGIVNYLAEADVRQTISVHAPQGFNPAHPGEAIDAMVLLKEAWNLGPDTR